MYKTLLLHHNCPSFTDTLSLSHCHDWWTNLLIGTAFENKEDNYIFKKQLYKDTIKKDIYGKYYIRLLCTKLTFTLSPQ